MVKHDWRLKIGTGGKGQKLHFFRCAKCKALKLFNQQRRPLDMGPCAGRPTKSNSSPTNGSPALAVQVTQIGAL